MKVVLPISIVLLLILNGCKLSQLDTKDRYSSVSLNESQKNNLFISSYKCTTDLHSDSSNFNLKEIWSEYGCIYKMDTISQIDTSAINLLIEHTDDETNFYNRKNYGWNWIMKTHEDLFVDQYSDLWRIGFSDGKFVPDTIIIFVYRLSTYGNINENLIKIGELHISQSRKDQI